MAFSFNKVCSNLIPTGKYKVQVTDIKLKVNGVGTSTKDFVVNYTIVDGPYAKKTLIDTIYENSFSFRLRPFLTACKVDMAREFETAEEMYNYGMAAAKNKILLVDVTVRSYNGKDYNNIANFYPLPDSKTTLSEVVEELDVTPNLKGDLLSSIQEETSVPVADEPVLDFDFSDDTDI